MSLKNDIIKNGTAVIIERIQNERNLNGNSMAPRLKDVPSKILLFHVFLIPNKLSPANPSVNTPISAALRFCLYITRVCPSMLLLIKRDLKTTLNHIV